MNKISKDISTYQNIALSYIKNKDNITTNPMLGVHVKLNTKTNLIIKVTYSVTAFNNKNTYGYHSKYDYTTLEKAVEDYNKICNDESHLVKGKQITIE